MRGYVKPLIEVIDLTGENILMASCTTVCDPECDVYTCNTECVGYCEPECIAAGTDI